MFFLKLHYRLNGNDDVKATAVDDDCTGFGVFLNAL
jgi:hypothetical protein